MTSDRPAMLERASKREKRFDPTSTPICIQPDVGSTAQALPHSRLPPHPSCSGIAMRRARHSHRRPLASLAKTAVESRVAQ